MIWIITVIVVWSILGIIICTSIEESLKNPDQPKDEHRVARHYIMENGPNAKIDRAKKIKFGLSIFGYGTVFLIFFGVSLLGWKLAIVFLPLSFLVIWRAKKTIYGLRRYGWLITKSEYDMLAATSEKPQ